MKKYTKLASTLLASMFVVAGLSSCGGGSGSKDTLEIVYYSAGFNETWINTLANKFEQTHEGIKVHITASYSSEQIISQHLASRNNPDDLYISTGNSWKSNAATGKFADLTDFLNDEVDGVTVKDKVNDEYADSFYFTKSDGSKATYRLPFTSGIGGIFYNKKMFEENGWNTWLKNTYSTNTTGVPETYDQLIALCDKIIEKPVAVPGDPDGTAAVKPFIYAGTDTDYFDYTVFDWWGQIAGKEAIKDFLKYDSPDNFNVTKNETYNALKTATSKWNNIFGSNTGYYVEGQNTTTAANAQKSFVNGYAAMMFNGDWLYNETLNYTQTGTFENFELGLMKTPVLSEAKAGSESTSYVIGEDQYIAIPASSSKKELAQDFIKLMISQEGNEVFINQAHGFLAYKADYSAMNVEDTYMQRAIALRSSYDTKFTNFSNDRKFLTNNVDIWSSAANRPFLSILNGQKKLDQAFTDISTYVAANWTTWTNNSK